MKKRMIRNVLAMCVLAAAFVLAGECDGRVVVLAAPEDETLAEVVAEEAVVLEETAPEELFTEEMEEEEERSEEGVLPEETAAPVDEATGGVEAPSDEADGEAGVEAIAEEAMTQNDTWEGETTEEVAGTDVNETTVPIVEEPVAEGQDAAAEVSEEELDTLWEQAEISYSEEYTGDVSVISFTIQLTL